MKKEELKKASKTKKEKINNNKTRNVISKETKTKESITKEKLQPNKSIIILGIILIIVIIVSLIVNLNKKNNEPETKEPTIIDENEPIINNNEGIVKNQEIDGLTFTQTSLISQDGETYLTTEIKNNNNTDYELEEIHIIIKDKDGNFVISYQNENAETVNYLVGYIGDVIVAGETKSIITTIDQVISNDAYNIEYKIIK